jgi:hypothetical protein
MGTPAPKPVQVKSLYCPNCGGTVALKGFANTLTVTCQHCASVLDTSQPSVRILMQFDERQIRRPLIPLGSRGKFDNTLYEVIGFQVRSDESEEWEWEEYVLFNPYKGFLYLTGYKGHWNLVRPLRALPGPVQVAGRPGALWQGRKHRHFANATAKTLFVLGEFPWKVQVGEIVHYDDYISPPYVLSAEHTDNETTWSEGEYMEGALIWKALGLQGAPPSPSGVYLNQPAPATGAKAVWKLCLALELGLLLLAGYFYITDRHETVYQQSRTFVQSAGTEASWVTPVFELKGRPSNVQIRTEADLSNHWLFFGYALINSDTGHAYDFGRELSYYSGTDSDGAWTEGDRSNVVTIPSVPAGRYYLRVEPEGDPGTPEVRYQIVVRRDIPNGLFFILAALLIPLPAIVIGWRGGKFEMQRWAESDYASGGGDD